MTHSENYLAIPSVTRFISRIKPDAVVFFFLFILIAIIYSASFKGVWLYDDYVNIVNNKNIRLTDLTVDQVKRSILRPTDLGKEKISSRPLAYFSFAVNYYFGKYNPFGYHVVNVLIHFLSSCFLYLFIKKTLLIPSSSLDFKDKAHTIAFISAVLWAVHPVHVTGVTYVIQRMASMAGMFFVAAMLFYLLGRTADTMIKRLVFITLCCLSSLMAFSVKENTAMLPVILVVYDFLIIQETGKNNKTKTFVCFFGAFFLLMVLGFIYTNPFVLSAGFENRPFTLFERVVTAPRVVVYYISLLIYPILPRLTLLHDIHYSTSMISPWTTMASMVFIAATLFYAVRLYLKKQVFVCFCILFFYLNHLIEASVISLELIFEHRNYIPMMMFWPPFVILILKAIDFFAYHKPLQLLTVFTLAVVMASFGSTTYSYCNLFRNRTIFWQDNVKKSPGLSVVHNNYGNMLWRMGEYEKAGKAFKTAFELDHYMNLAQKGITSYNLGLYHADWENNRTKSMQYLKKAVRIAMGYKPIWREIIKNLQLEGHGDRAFWFLKNAVSFWPDDDGFRTLMAIALLKRGNLNKAYEQVLLAQSLNQDSVESLRVMGEICRQKGWLPKAIHYWETYLSLRPYDFNGVLALIELYDRAGNEKAVLENVGKFYYLNPDADITRFIKESGGNAAIMAYVPSVSIIAPIFHRTAEKIGSP